MKKISKSVLLILLCGNSNILFADTSNGPDPYGDDFGFDKPQSANWGLWSRGGQGTLHAEWDNFVDSSSPEENSALPDKANQNINQASLTWNDGVMATGSGNLYSFSVPQTYEINLAGTTGLGSIRVVLQFETQGTEMNYDSIQLNRIPPTHAQKTYQNPQYQTSRGPTDLVHYIAIWDLPAELTEYNFAFSSNPHQSLTQVSIDIAQYDPGVDITNTQIDDLYDWAEAQFVDLFPNSSSSEEIFGYYARCYNSGICIGSKGGNVYAVGGIFGNEIILVGGLTNLMNAAGM